MKVEHSKPKQWSLRVKQWLLISVNIDSNNINVCWRIEWHKTKKKKTEIIVLKVKTSTFPFFFFCFFLTFSPFDFLRLSYMSFSYFFLSSSPKPIIHTYIIAWSTNACDSISIRLLSVASNAPLTASIRLFRSFECEVLLRFYFQAH